MKRLLGAIVFLLVSLSVSSGAYFQAQTYSPAVATFTPQFQSAKISSGGLLNNISISRSDGTTVLTANTYGAYLYRTSGTCDGAGAGGWGTTFSAPCWEQLFTSNSVAGWTLADADNLAQGVLDAVSCNNNTSDAYAIFNHYLYVTTTLTGSAASRTWARTTLNGFANGNATSAAATSHMLACDPANPNIIYAATPTALKISANGLSGGSATFATVSGVGTTGALPSLIAFDPNSTTGTCAAISGSPTCTKHVYVFTDQVGMYETTDGGSTWVLTSSGPVTAVVNQGSHVIVDKFGQVWAVMGDLNLYKYVPNGTAGGGTWTTLTNATTSMFNRIDNVATDPTSASSGTQRIVVAENAGAISVSTNNGVTWSGESLTPGNDNTFSATGAQPAWMGNSNQYGNGGNTIFLDMQDMAFDASGNLWGVAGIGAWKMPAGGIANNGNWAADSIGIEQLVANWILSAPGNAPIAAVWDRGFFTLQNPDTFPAHYWADAAYSKTIGFINGGWAIDYSSFNAGGATCSPSCNFFAGWEDASANLGASTADGGQTWTIWPNQPGATNLGGAIAASSQTHWIVNSGQNLGLYYTSNAAASAWTSITTAAATPYSGQGGRQPLAADRVNADTYCLVDHNLAFWRSTAWPPVFSQVASAGATDGGAYNDKLQSVPGQAGHFFYSGGNNGGSSTGFHLWKSTDTCATWTDVYTGLTNIYGYGFGAPKPGGSGYPAIYAYGTIGGVVGIYENDDGATTTTWTLINAASAYPNNSLDFVSPVSGDMNVYGRIYVGFGGSGFAYIDTANACPWVNFTNIFATNNITGTVTLTSAKSGLVPLTSVQYSVDGSNIGPSLNGAGPYSYSWVTGGVVTGAHTLKVTATGNGCSGSFSIPITTH